MDAIDKAIFEDRLREELEAAKKLKPDIDEMVKSYEAIRSDCKKVSKQSLTSEQYEAFCWVHKFGFTAEIAGQVTRKKKTQQAISGLLTRLFKRYPSLSPKIQHKAKVENLQNDCRISKALKDMRPSGKFGEAGSDETGLQTGIGVDSGLHDIPGGKVPMSAKLFGDRRYDPDDKPPFHKPGKTWWPSEEWVKRWRKRKGRKNRK